MSDRAPLLVPDNNQDSVFQSLLTVIYAFDQLHARLDALSASIDRITPAESSATAMNWRGVWVANAVYRTGDVVFDDPFTLVANKTTFDPTVPTVGDWDQMSKSAP